MDWFEEWFDSELYEKLYANRDEQEARQLIQLLEQTLSSKGAEQILDLACGRGRHSLSLAQKGYEVTGVDLSEASIKAAKQKASNRQLNNVHFDVHDMRKPLDQTFDAIVNLFTSFGYFLDDHENAHVFDNVAQMLKPEGTFVFDYLNAAKVKENYVPADRGSFNDVVYQIKRYIKDNAIHKDITFTKNGQQKTYSERVKLYELDWFKQELGQRNFTIEQIYGDYQGNAFDQTESPRLLIISKFE